MCMDALTKTIQEALKAGREPQVVVDVLLEHGVSKYEIRSAWPDELPCPLFDRNGLRESGLEKTLRGTSWEDVPQVSAPPRRDRASVWAKIKAMFT